MVKEIHKKPDLISTGFGMLALIGLLIVDKKGLVLKSSKRMFGSRLTLNVQLRAWVSKPARRRRGYGYDDKRSSRAGYPGGDGVVPRGDRGI